MKQFGAATAIILVLTLAGAGLGQQMIQYGFEGRSPLWLAGPHDAGYKEKLHELTDKSMHGGQRSETIQFEAENGSYIHYTYNLGRAPVTDDLNVSLWVRANRAGVQLLARVVFPKEWDPNNPGHLLTVLLPGDRYQVVQRWQPLTLPLPVKLLRQQQQLLAGTLKREINAADAYVDQLVLNVYTGPGETRLWIDDLEAGPAFDVPDASGAPPAAASSDRRDGGSAKEMTPARPAINHRPDEVRLEGGHLKVGNERLFMLGIRHTGTPLGVLRKLGLNTVWLDESAPSGLIEQAANEGFWIVPTLHAPEVVEQPSGKIQGQLVANEAFHRNVSRFLGEKAVLCWDLGGNLPWEKSRAVMNTAQAIHNVDPLRPLAVDVRDGFLSYSRAGNQQLMIGTHRWPLLTSLELTDYRQWLMQRRMLLPPDSFCWTWIQTHLPDWFMTAAYERTSGRFSEPIGPHPEQIRLLSYIAVGCGYRGLGYWSDRFLADSHMGRDRLLALALLNQEFRLLEPLLVTVTKEPQWIQGLYPKPFPTLPDQPNPNVMAAVLTCDKAVLVLPIWLGPGSQYLPPQGYFAQVRLKVMVPDNYAAWEVSPGCFRSYPSKPVLGGREIVMQNLTLTSAIVFTADVVGRGSLVPRFQEMQRSMHMDAAQWAHDQAQEEIIKAARIHEELKTMGKKIHDADDVLDTSRKWLEKSHKHRLNGEFEEAYADAQLALRAVRILMRQHWDAALKKLTTPVACPFALSFFTLPRFWQYYDEISKLYPWKSVLTDGDFEWPPHQPKPEWGLEETKSLDGVVGEAKRVVNNPREGRQSLMLKLSAKNPLKAALVLERTFLAIHSPAVHLPPGTPVRISAWMFVPEDITGSPDGALFYDSAGGEPLAVRLSQKTTWRQFILYRTVPESGSIHVTMALTGLGTVYFDDVRIEPLYDKEPPKEPMETAAPATQPDKTEPQPSGNSWSSKISALFRPRPAQR
ncbi:MAG TPA: hypothetical protein VMF69_14160 [Gemmataceae bacterium]|nr:hypothetical protein [Gemmataceae bacterium]